ncbi:thermonuclease family protein [Cognatiyoonia sp. IB215182]|uniref:thermonuclease family protein n=1 Tax=Cognatiyoonia sp. IB215182 TaxID=3097353 RepID=UPI002A0F61C9|nr:thermonuclease family protein [Cognatiyoonia sp. IB215182]MDX8353977.1 thermonuclease family protein [Cognatiyoonia sp. IB215182]
MRKAICISMSIILFLLACAPTGKVALRVIDGDTVDAGLETNVRLTLNDGSGFDTPETFRASCPAEADLGVRATQRLRQLLDDAVTTDLKLGSRSCGFGRYCGVLTADGTNVGETLINEGLAKRSQNFDWCSAI